MGDYGFKVSKAGFDVLTTADKNLIFSSAFGSLKVHTQGTGTLTDSARTITVAHGLGYVPMFLVHTQTEAGYFIDDDDYVIAPHVPIIAGGCYLDRQVTAWADSTNLYIKAEPNFGVGHYSLSSTTLNECLAQVDDLMGYQTSYIEMGYQGDTGENSNTGGYRFGGVLLDQGASIYTATVIHYIGGRNGAGEVKLRIYGIDEDNTGKFDAGQEFHVRDKTTAYVDHNTTASTGDYVSKDVKSIVSEIIVRVGWSSGNAMGFVLNDNSTVGDNTYYEEAATSPWGAYCSKTNLKIVESNTLASIKYTIYYNQIE